MVVWHHAEKGMRPMAEILPTKVLDSLDLDALKKFRAETNRRIKNEKAKRRFKTNVEIPAEYYDHFKEAIDWAYEHNLIKTHSRWAFCKFCITQWIDCITGEIEKEKLAKAQTGAAIPLGTTLESRSSIQNTP